MKRRTYIVAYDVCDPRRLRRVFQALKSRALHVQYSVFLGRFTVVELDRLWADLGSIVGPQEDDVRAYPVPETPDWVRLGRDPLPEAVHLLEGREQPLIPPKHGASVGDGDSD